MRDILEMVMVCRDSGGETTNMLVETTNMLVYLRSRGDNSDIFKITLDRDDGSLIYQFMGNNEDKLRTTKKVKIKYQNFIGLEDEIERDMSITVWRSKLVDGIVVELNNHNLNADDEIEIGAIFSYDMPTNKDVFDMIKLWAFESYVDKQTYSLKMEN